MPTRFGGSITDYPNQNLACRAQDGRHAMPGVPTWEVTTGPAGLIIEYHRALACTRCGYAKVDHFDATMRRSRRPTTRYPKGYLAAPGNAEELTPAQARLEQFARSAGRHQRRDATVTPIRRTAS